MVTQGTRLFVRWMEREGLTYRAAAKLLKRSAPTVFWWAQGKTTPDTASAVALQRHARIPIEAWTRPPRGKAA